MIPKKILLHENKANPQEMLKNVLARVNWEITVTHNLKDALAALEAAREMILIVDIDNIEADGMSLIRQALADSRLRVKILVFTAHRFEQMHQRVLAMGVSEILTVPIDFGRLGTRLYELHGELSRSASRKAESAASSATPPVTGKPPFVGICIAVSTGGPQTLEKLFGGWKLPRQGALFVVQHGPPWALESIAKSLRGKYGDYFLMAENGMTPETGKVYFAPGNKHLCISGADFSLKLVESPPENFLRPAADPLFRSAAETFRKFAIGVVLSGMGSDGTLGVKNIQEGGGMILVQDPKTCISPFMPRSAINSGVPHTVAPLERMGRVISIGVDKVARFLA